MSNGYQEGGRKGKGAGVEAGDGDGNTSVAEEAILKAALVPLRVVASTENNHRLAQAAGDLGIQILTRGMKPIIMSKMSKMSKTKNENENDNDNENENRESSMGHPREIAGKAALLESRLEKAWLDATPLLAEGAPSSRALGVRGVLLALRAYETYENDEYDESDEYDDREIDEIGGMKRRKRVAMRSALARKTCARLVLLLADPDSFVYLSIVHALSALAAVRVRDEGNVTPKAKTKEGVLHVMLRAFRGNGENKGNDSIKNSKNSRENGSVGSDDSDDEPEEGDIELAQLTGLPSRVRALVGEALCACIRRSGSTGTIPPLLPSIVTAAGKW